MALLCMWPLPLKLFSLLVWHGSPMVSSGYRGRAGVAFPECDDVVVFAGLVERRSLVGAAVVVAIAGVVAALVPVRLLPGYSWFLNVPYLCVGVLSVAACRWRGVRSSGRYRLFWLLLSASMAAWSFGEAMFLLLNSFGLYSFPSWLDLCIVVSNVLVCIALLIYPSEPTVTRLRRLMDSVMITLAIALLIWQLWLGPLIAASHGKGLLLNVASSYFPVAGTLMLVVAVITLAHAPAPRRPLAVITIGYVLLAIGGIWYANMQTDGNGMRYAGFAFNIASNFCLVLAPLLRSPGPQEGTDDRTQASDVSFLPYIPLLLALCVSTVSYVTRSAGTTEVIVSIALVALLLTRQYLTLRQNVALTRQVKIGQEELRHQALHDALTGLANRALFADRLQHALALRSRSRRSVSLLYVDLDGFKAINDTKGHLVGDQLLRSVADRLRLATRASDTIARLGGDEFAVLLEDGLDPLPSAQRICEVLRLPFDIESEAVRIGCSIGVVELTDDEDISPETFLSRADVAMYQAKRSGRGGAVLHRDGMSLVEPGDGIMRDLLEKALDDGSFGVALQPIVEIATGRVVAVEALARLQHESMDTRPRVFIDAADRTGVLPALTDALLQEACARSGELFAQTEGVDRLRAVHLNVLPSQIGSPELLSTITHVFASGELQRGQLVLEIAETALGEDIAAFREAVVELRAAGVKIALDDFGFGHSSLSRLGDIEVDILKIDASVLNRVDTDQRQSAIVGTLLDLAGRLGTPVIAQGIERHGQLAEVQRLGCRLAQGYLLGRPALASEITPEVVTL